MVSAHPKSQHFCGNYKNSGLHNQLSEPLLPEGMQQEGLRNGFLPENEAPQINLFG